MRPPMRPTPLLLALAFVACGDDDRPGADVSADVPDLADTSDTADAPDAEDTAAPPDVADTTDTPDTADTPDTPDTPDTADTPDTPDTQGPRVCADFEACTERLDDQGVCPGRCMPTPDTLTCHGPVVEGVCHTHTPAPTVNEVLDLGAVEVRPIRVPSAAKVGETHDLVVHLVNKTNETVDVSFRWKNPDTWTLEDISWANLDGFTLGPRVTAALTARITARTATVFSGGGSIIVTFIIDDTPYEPRAAVSFPDTEPIACGDFHFPETFCGGEGCIESRQHYASARCCDEVFFPGATCCDDADCVSGACVDGKCVHDAPWLGSANNAPLGHQKIRFVLVDSHPQFADDPCKDRSAELTELDLATVEAWFDDLAVRRLGRESMDIQWVVTGGVATSDFLTGSAYWDNYSKELDAWLTDRGCPMLEGYDKVIVAASTLDLQGFGGIYYDRGHIGAFTPYSPYLLVHELAHSFGATDLYLDLGGPLLYPEELMGNDLSGPPLPGDAVAWAELGFGDVDRDGLVDLLDLAAFPESLTVRNLTATITPKATLELRWEFAGLEEGLLKRVVVSDFGVDFPAANTSWDTHYSGRWKTAVFESTQVDLPALEAAGETSVRIRSSYTYTDRDWSRRTLTLDQTFTVPVTRSP